MSPLHKHSMPLVLDTLTLSLRVGPYALCVALPRIVWPTVRVRSAARQAELERAL